MFSSNQVKCSSLFIILVALVKLERHALLIPAHLFTWAQVIKMGTQNLYRKSNLVYLEKNRKTLKPARVSISSLL